MCLDLSLIFRERMFLSGVFWITVGFPELIGGVWLVALSLCVLPLSGFLVCWGSFGLLVLLSFVVCAGIRWGT